MKPKKGTTKPEGNRTSKETPQIKPSILNHLLSTYPVPHKFSPQQIQEGISQFDAFVRGPKVAGLGHQEKMKAFRAEKAWTGDEEKDFKIGGAIFKGWLITTGDRKALEDLMTKKRGEQGGFARIYKFECPKCGSVDARGITRRLSQLPEDEALGTPLGTKEKEKCPECGAYVQFKMVRARSESWTREQQKRKVQRRRTKSSYEIWSMPLSPEQLEELDQIDSEHGYRNKIYQWLEKWLKEHQELVEKEAHILFAPNNRRESELKALARPIKKGGLGLKYPDQYPFGIHFLLVNLLAQIHRIRPQIMNVIFRRVSKTFMRKETGSLSLEGWETLSNQAQVYLDVVKHLAKGGAIVVTNFETYFKKSLTNSFLKAKRPPGVAKKLEEDEETGSKRYVYVKRQILEADMGKRTEGPESEEEEITLETIQRQESSHYEDELNRRIGVNKILDSHPQRLREAAFLTASGFTQEEIAKKLGVSVKTIKRGFQTFRSDPRLQELHEP